MGIAMVIDRCPIQKITAVFDSNGKITAQCGHPELALPARNLQSLALNHVDQRILLRRNRSLVARR